MRTVSNWTRALQWSTTSLLVMLALGAAGVQADPPPGTRERVNQRVFDAEGRLIWEYGEMRDDQDMRFARHITHAAKPGGGGGGALTDCTATQYKLAGWKWSAPYSAMASSYADVLNVSAQTWDAATGGSILGGITPGSAGVAGVQDFKNQMDWVDLGLSTTIAVTTTWYYLSTGQAVESDAQYNTFYLWSATGDPAAMDVQNIGTHEIGHTFGLGHPTGKPSKISCLTMYAYGAEGELQKRTLGDGDILGIRRLYGA